LARRTRREIGARVLLVHLFDAQRVAGIRFAGRLARLAGDARQSICGVGFGYREYAPALQIVHQGTGVRSAKACHGSG